MAGNWELIVSGFMPNTTFTATATSPNPSTSEFSLSGDPCPSGPYPSWVVPPGDSDCDAFTDADEGVIGTDPADACANTSDPDDEADDRWPSDFDDNQVINILDVNQTLPPFFGYVCT